MNKLNKWYLKLQKYENGQTMAEYGLILAAVATLCLVAYQTLGGNISTLLGTVSAAL